MLKKLAGRLARDLVLVPITAFLIHLFVASLPLRADTDAKLAGPSSIQRQMEDQLGVGQPLGFLRPWQLLFSGERIGTDSRRYDLEDLTRALAGSLRIGGMALVLALALACTFAALRALAARRAGDQLLELVPTLVYGTPTFILALVVATFTSVSIDDDKRAFEPIAAMVMAIGPGIFLGVILNDALRAELSKPYVTTAVAKGRTRLETLTRHALPNAILVLLDAVPPVATSLLAGSFVVEKLFNVSYFGLLYVFAAQNKQVALVVVGTTIFATLLIVVSFTVEVLKIVLDPRAKTEALEAT
ncbi:ABC transporter permease subunit [Myxococcota bacterium]|nr:ABC transporter permease subunit [Myxococcota bacterium]